MKATLRRPYSVEWPELERLAKPRGFVQSDSSPGHPAAQTIPLPRLQTGACLLHWLGMSDHASTLVLDHGQ